MNKVIAGDYIDYAIYALKGSLYFTAKGFGSMPLDKNNIESYEVITSEHTKDAASGIARGAIGGALLGPVGLLAGGLLAKNKGVYTIAVKFKDGKNSLIEANDDIYKTLLKVMF